MRSAIHPDASRFAGRRGALVGVVTDDGRPHPRATAATRASLARVARLLREIRPRYGPVQSRESEPGLAHASVVDPLVKNASVSPPASAVREAVGRLRDEGLHHLAGVRLVGAAAFLLVSSWLSLVYELEGWRIHLAPLALYAVIAIVLRLSRRGHLNAWAVPFLDVPALFALQLVSMPVSPHPAGVAGWSLGLFALMTVLAALAFDTPVLVATVLVGSVAEGILQRAADVSWGAVIASAIVLALTAFAMAWAGRRLLAMVGHVVTSEVARRVAEEHNEELARAAATVERVNAELREAQRNAETLTNLLVHDMKGPLTGVIGTFDLVEMRTEDLGEIPELSTDLELGRRSAARLLGMIGDLLGIARLEKGEICPARRDADIHAIVEDVARDHARSAASRGVELGRRVPAALHACIDDELLRRALDNLVANAISFAPRGRRVEIEAARQNGFFLLSVRNDGPTIPVEARDRLFGKHSMLGARRGHHAGLGLYLCRLVAEAHGGTIALVDEPGWAVSFVMSLPEA